MLAVEEIQGVTIREICSYVGKSQQAVAKRDLSAFEIGQRSNGGRPEKLYKPEVLSVFGVSVQKSVEKSGRKGRSDAGKTRKYPAHAISRWVDLAEAHILNLGEYNAYFAAEKAVVDLIAEHPDCASSIQKNFFYCYKQFILPSFKERKTKNFWLQRNQQQHAAQTALQLRYDIPKLLENAGVAGRGFGFGRLIMLDDRVSKMRSELDGTFVTHTGIYVWCVLTGALLWVETVAEGTGVSTQSYARALLAAVFAHKLPANPIVFLENASSSAAVRLENLVCELWDADELIAWRNDPTLFYAFGQQQGPVYRNLPHLPTAFGKSTGEAFMKVVLKRHDATYREQFNRVSLHVSNQPWLLVKSPNRALERLSKSGLLKHSEYANSVMQWFWNERANDNLRSLMGWASERGLEPTRNAMIAYYSGNQGQLASDYSLARIGKVLYHATPTRLYHTCKSPGQFSATLQKNKVHLIVPGITIQHVGLRLAAIPNPLQDSEWLVYVIDDETDTPLEFLGVGSNAHITTFEQAAFVRQTASAERKRQTQIIEKGLREKLSKLPAMGIAATEQLPEQPMQQAEQLQGAQEVVHVVAEVVESQGKARVKASAPLVDIDEWDDDIFDIL